MKKLIAAAIDVAAAKLVVVIQGGSEVRTFDNDEKGHKALLKVLKKHRVGRVGIEPTGSYGFDVMLALAEAQYEVISINPRAARAFARANMTRGKTDNVDAAILLDYTMRMASTPWKAPEDSVIQLRAISRRLQQVVKMVAAEKARLAALVPQKTPKLVRDHVEASIERLEADAEALVDAALQVANASPKLKRAIEVFVSIRGIAERTAVKLLGELAALPDDLTPRQLVAMVGLDPRPFESGKSKGTRRISKWGNAHLRGILYIAAHNAVRWEPSIGQLYADLVARGKHHMKAMVAVMRKLLHALWGMFRTETTFDPSLFRPAHAVAA